MIRNIFAPESYNGYYLFTTHIVSIHVTHAALYATHLVASGYDRTIQQHIYESLDQDATLTFAERSDNAIQRIKEQIPTYHRLHIVLPSKDAIFKELTLPFTNKSKIDMVAPFEIEESLPFSLDEAVIETIPLNKEAEQTTILAIVFRKETVASYISAFEHHDLSPDITTCDAVAYYTAFRDIQDFAPHDAVTVYIDIDITESRIFVIDHGILRLIRTIKHGINSVCDLSTNTYNNLHNSIKACDIQEQQMSKTKLASDIQFTLAAINKKIGPDTKVSHIAITGLGSSVSHIAESLGTMVSVTPHTLNANLPLRMPHIRTNMNTHIPPVFMTSFAGALPADQEHQINIRTTPVTPRERTSRTYQLAAATGMTILFFVGFFVYSMYQASTFRSAIQKREQELRKELSSTFNVKKTAPLSQLLRTTIPNKVSQEESLWFSLSQQRTFSFLYYLQELSAQIDRKDLGLTLKKLSISRDSKTGAETVKLEGTVRDYQALRRFEEALRDTKLFVQVPRLQEPKFDLTLTVTESPQETS